MDKGKYRALILPFWCELYFVLGALQGMTELDNHRIGTTDEIQKLGNHHP